MADEAPRKPKTTIAQRPLLFLDTETTGLDPAKHEILEIAILDVEGKVLFESKIKPVRIETAHPKALEVNGYTEEEWKDAPTFAEVATQVAEILKGCIPCGHNVSFDMNFIKAALGAVDPELLKGIGYHLVDTVSMAYNAFKDTGTTSLSLWACCKILGIENEQAHRARGDAEACRQVYYAILNADRETREQWTWQMPV